MTILVTGSRTWTRLDLVRSHLRPYLEDGARIIQGGARGADQLAREVADEFGSPVKTMPADWDQHGKRAGILRNCAMLDEKPDLVLAFWDGASRGTQHCIGEAHRRGIPVVVVKEETHNVV